MACHKPLQAYRLPFGGVTFSKNKGTVPLKLPCGQCMGCRLSHGQQWAIRAVHESMMHEENSFLTLTYNADNLPEDLGLHHEHFQVFMKKLRRIGPFEWKEKTRNGKKVRVKVSEIKYLMCGEYGSQGDRPHYHALIFGYDFPDKYLWTDNGKSKLYRSEMLEELWPLGISSIGEVNYQTASYVAGYIRKKQKGKSAKEINPETGLKAYELYNDDGLIIQRRPEYAQMSRNPGLGQTFYETYGDRIRYMDSVVINGKQLRVPKYYDKLTEREDPALLESIKRYRTNKARRHSRNNTPERLEAREAYAQAVVNKTHKRSTL